MISRPDIAIRAANSTTLALVDVKNLPNLSLGDAVRVRDELAEHRRLGASAKYFLILSQGRGFIWELDENGEFAAGAEGFSMRPVLREYLTEAELDRHIRGADLELVLLHWLGDLARGKAMQPADVGGNGPFARFTSEIRGAEVLLETAA
jgi:hypothetical protein